MKADTASLVIPRAEIPTAIERFPELDMTAYGTFFYAYTPGVSGFEKVRSITEKAEADVWQALAKTLKSSHIPKGRIGIDESRISIQLWEQLETDFPEIEFVPAMNMFSKARMIKHQAEIKLLEKSAEIAEESMLKVLLNLKVGMSEYEIGRQYITEVTKCGADPFFNVVTAGERTPLCDTVNTDNKIVDGSIIRVDFGCIFQGYRSDLARTAVVGKSSSKLEEYYCAILKGEEEAIAKVKPGVVAEDIFAIAVDETRKAGIPHYERHHCGHGIGLEVYDPPTIAPGVKAVLEPGMVLCIETPYYELGWAGIQVEDTIAVTNEGYRFLSKSSRELIKVGV
jgi:Xaa-Pro aminopeptidase